MAVRGALWALAMLSMVCHCAGSAQHAQTHDSVIQKVVEMLEANGGKVAADLAAEEREVAEYSAFCDEQITTKDYAIKDSVRKIADLDAVIEDASSQLKGVNDEIVSLGSELSEKDKDLRANDETKRAEQAEFKNTEATLIDSVDQLEKAIMMVKGDQAAFLQKKETKGAKKTDRKAFVKTLAKVLGGVIDAAWVGGANSNTLKGFMQEEQKVGAADAEDLSLKHKAKQPEASKEEGGVLQTLEDMKTKAQEAISKTRLDAMKGDHSSQMVKQSIVGAIELAQGKLSEDKTKKGTLGETIGKAKGELSDAKRVKVSDSIYLTSLKKDCASAAEEWADRQKEAKDEMAAIAKAKEILSKRVKVLVQKSDGFLDGDDESSEQTPERKKLVQHLKSLGHEFSSYALAELASAAATDPMEKVKGIITEMVAKLMNEAADEATQKTFCDEEKAKSLKEKDEKSMRADELANRVDVAKATKAALGDAIKELEAQIAGIDKATAEATAIRNEEHATYEKASKDFKDAAEAVTDAMRVLKEYYSGASLTQVRNRATSTLSQAWKAPRSDAASSILSILEMSGEEFTKMYMESETEEKVAADAYATLMEESKTSKVAKEAEAKGAESEVKTLDVAVSQGREDYKMVSKELDAVLEYIQKLKPQCDAKVSTFEEKKAKREQEIEGLKEALSILDAPALVQTQKK